LEGLEDLPQLRELDFSHNQVTEIKGLLKNSALEVLIVSYNSIDDFQVLAPLEQVRYFEGIGNLAAKTCPWTDSHICRFDWLVLSI